jgi:hypothetical protein
MKRSRPGPLLLAVVLHVALCTALLAAVTAVCRGRLTYALDDAYIHLAMARTLAEHGVWGITPHEFTSSSSSPLWTMMLSGTFKAGGTRAGWPLVLNLLLGLVLLRVAHDGVRRLAPRAGRLWALAVLVGVVVLTPLPMLTFIGQEHVLHAALALAFALAAAHVIEAPHGARNLERAALPVLAAAMVSARYEGLFLAAAAALLLLAHRKRAEAWSVAFGALLPVALYAWFSSSQGWFALPNPVLLKGNLADAARVRAAVGGLLSGQGTPDGVLAALGDVARLLGLTACINLVNTPHMAVLVGAAIGLSTRRLRLPAADPGRTLLLLFAGAAVMHLQFARTGWFHRYEAYLVCLGVVAVGARLAALPRYFDSSMDFDEKALRATRIRRIVIAAMVLAPLLIRGLTANGQVPRATANVHEQQVQMGLFLAEHYRDSAVAVNDIGAVNWLADLRCLDMMGLATLEVGKRRMDLTWHRDAIDELAERARVRIAVVYDAWFDRDATGGLPERWEPVERWTIARNLVAGEDTVTFYAVAPGERATLEASLHAFAAKLPLSVRRAPATPRR